MNGMSAGVTNSHAVKATCIFICISVSMLLTISTVTVNEKIRYGVWWFRGCSSTDAFIWSVLQHGGRMKPSFLFCQIRKYTGCYEDKMSKYNSLFDLSECYQSFLLSCFLASYGLYYYFTFAIVLTILTAGFEWSVSNRNLSAVNWFSTNLWL